MRQNGYAPRIEQGRVDAQSDFERKKNKGFGALSPENPILQIRN